MRNWAFLKLFSLSEFRSISGVWFSNLIILIVIFFIALIAIGLGNGTTNYLRVKMDDPFIKFVNIIRPSNFQGETDLLKDLKMDSIKNRYLYDTHLMVNLGYADFIATNGKIINATVRGVKKEDKFYEFVANSKDITDDNTLFERTDWGCIVTEGLLKKMGYKRTDSIAYLKYKYNIGGKDTIIPLPVAAIVKELPGYVDLLVSERLLAVFNGKYIDTCPLDITSENHKIYWSIFTKIDADKRRLGDLGFIEYEYQSKSYVSGYLMQVQRQLLEDDFDFNELMQQLDTSNTIRVYDFTKSTLEAYRPFIPDEISIVFKELDSVSAFQEYLYMKHKLKIDMNTIEAKENFNFFEKLSRLLSFALIIFSILTIVVFITNLVISHLEKNKKNLGTLKAFGLPNSYLIRLYSGISTVLITIAFLVSYFLSTQFGDLALKLILQFSQFQTENDTIVFELYPISILALCFICLPALFIVVKLFLSLKNNTPGDLIYERD